MLTASAIAAQEKTQEEVQNQESEDSEDKDFTGEEEQQDDLESDIAEGELIEEQETMEETFKNQQSKCQRRHQRTSPLDSKRLCYKCPSLLQSTILKCQMSFMLQLSFMFLVVC